MARFAVRAGRSRRLSNVNKGNQKRSGRPCLIEGLELRQMLSFDAHVSFRPQGSTPPSGYVVDNGKTFADRGNGLQYGWSAQVGEISDRWGGSALQRTFAGMQSNGNLTWEIAVPNGAYTVHVSAGEANGWNDLQKINAEGTTVVNATPTSDKRWVEGTATVTVTDGKLTLTNASPALRNKINYVDIVSADGSTNPTPPPTDPTPPPTTDPTPPPTDPTPPPPTNPTPTGDAVKINFQPANAGKVAGYLVDSGTVFGSRGNGYAYGWNAAVGEVADRWAGSALQRTFAGMQSNGSLSWEIAVPNGTYTVHLSAGDANAWNDTVNITAEGASVLNARTSNGARWVEGTASVTVADGKLTIANGAGATGNKINFIEITPTGGTTTPPPTDPTTPPPTDPTTPPPTDPTPPPPTNNPDGVIVGTNLDGLADWATVSPLVDLTSLFRQWGSLSKTYEPDPSIPLTADNYPLRDAGSITYAYGYPDGRYKVSYDGIGSLNFSGMNARYTVLSHVGDHWEGYLDITPSSSKGSILEMRLTGINPANPVRNLHILSPDRDPAVSDVFRPVFLNKLKPFNGPLRMMDWTQTNNNQSIHWTDRQKATKFSFSDAKGLPYEYIVKLANTLGKDLWVNIPYHASDDYIRQMARFFRDSLSPNLRLYVEYSNEVWNPVFEQMRANQAAAWADTGLTKTDDFGRQAQKFGKLNANAAKIFKDEFGAARYASQVRYELGTLIAGDYYARTALEWVRDNVGDPKSLFYGVAVAPYVGVQGDMDAIDNSSLTTQKLFDWMNGWVDGQLTDWIRQNKRLADQYGLELDSYEAGQSLSYLNQQNADLKTRAQDDPRMGDFYKHLIRVWHKESGGGIFGNFALSTNYGPYGFWGLFQSIDQATSVKYEAVTSMIGKVV